MLIKLEIMCTIGEDVYVLTNYKDRLFIARTFSTKLQNNQVAEITGISKSTLIRVNQG